MKQLSLGAMLGIWALLILTAIFFALWQGYNGRAFAATAITTALFLLIMLAFAARGTAERFTRSIGSGSSLVLAAFVLLLYIVYLFGTGTFALGRAAFMAGFVFVPLFLAMSSQNSASGSWQDFLTITGIWTFVKFGPSHYLWPYPGGRVAFVATVLVAVCVALATFLFSRRLSGVGYSIGWGKNWLLHVFGSFLLFGCVAIPLGISIHFIAFAPQWNRWSSFLGLSVAILIFTAWPEELLFRGLLQNLLARSSKSQLVGWWTASVLFGLSHITNGGFPNWRYVILASIAGLFYAWTWHKTGSIFASALVHAGVDVTWHFLFRTL